VFENTHLISLEPKPGKNKGLILPVQRKLQADGKLYPWKILGERPALIGNVLHASKYLPLGLKSFYSIKVYNENGVEMINPEDYKNQSELVFTADIPNFQEIINGSLELKRRLIHLKLPYKILTFYKAEKIVTPIEYLQGLAEHMAIPVVMNGDEFIHDFTFHLLSSLYLPTEVTTMMSKRAALVLEFLDYIDQHHSEFPGLEKLPNLFRSIAIPHAVENFDIHGDFFKDFWNLNSGFPEYAVSITAKMMFMNSRSPEHYLVELIKSLEPKDKRTSLQTHAKALINQFCTGKGAQSCLVDIPITWFESKNTPLLEAAKVQIRNLNRASLHQMK